MMVCVCVQVEEEPDDSEPGDEEADGSEPDDDTGPLTADSAARKLGKHTQGLEVCAPFPPKGLVLLACHPRLSAPAR